MDIVEFLHLAAPFNCIALAGYLVVWFVIRPLTFVYRIREGRLTVFSFLRVRAADLALADITSQRIVEGKSARSYPARSIQWLTPKFILPSSRFLALEANQRAYVLPVWLEDHLNSPDPAAALAASKQGQWAGQIDRFVGFLKESISQCARIAKRRFPALEIFCRRGSRCAAIVLIATSIWITLVDLVGIRLLCEEYRVSHWLLLRDDRFLVHLTSSAFVFLYGAVSLGILIKGARIPLIFAALGVFAALARFGNGPGFAHELSHAFFDSCTGYSDRLAGVGIACLISTAIMAAGSWLSRPRQAWEDVFEAATP